MRGWTAIALLALAGCDGVPDSRPAERASREVSVTAAELDALAQESGALPERNPGNPVGRYARRDEGGADSLCIVPDGRKHGHYRFGIETRIAQDFCRGSGTACLSGDRLVLRFEERGGDCLIVARHEGDAVVLPGAPDLRCVALCSKRGSFAGLRFPRLDRDAVAAAAMKDQAGQLLCR